MQKAFAFTLVELLVVITIIVVLVALIVPSMEQAAYQAQLASCATQLRGIAASAVAQATDNLGKYPYRQAIHTGHQQPGHLKHAGTDDRAAMLPFHLRYDWLTCPLTGKPLDIENSTLNQVRTTYVLFYGYQIYKSGGGAYKGMMRLGDRWEFQSRRFSVIASDWDFQQERGASARALTSHPGAQGKMTLVRYPNDIQSDWLHARWELRATYQRPAVDMNHAFEDGSVQQLNGLEWDETKEDRTVSVPHRGGDTDYNTEGWKIFVPPN